MTSGGTREGAGRPRRSGEVADVRVMLRLTPAEHAEIESAAQRHETSVSEFVRDAALRLARRGGRT